MNQLGRLDPALLWDRSGPGYRFWYRRSEHAGTPRAEDPERAANAAADFERAEVMDEREAEIGHQIA